VNLTNIQSVEKKTLRRFVGSVSPEKMRQICRALIGAVGCELA
jgi:mRNA-degrading endonuclease toxin of MazEF toxin-antitoxin module